MRLLVEERHGREQLDRPACDALAAIGGPEAVSGLLDVLDQVATDRHRHTAVLVLDALTRLRPPRAVTPLLASLWHYLPDHAGHVVRTLGAIGDPRAGSALSSWRTRPPRALACAATRSRRSTHCPTPPGHPRAGTRPPNRSCTRRNATRIPKRHASRPPCSPEPRTAGITCGTCFAPRHDPRIPPSARPTPWPPSAPA
ncbi:hypothetical protein O1M54_49955 [Streptomyces diastatochromogenes]|nr:hypothetical protein [Streptomyces diastatochromogenes]